MGVFIMEQKHTYQLAIYTNNGRFIKKAYVTSDINLTGILREWLFIQGAIDTHIEHMIEVPTS